VGGKRRGGNALAAWAGAAPVRFRESGCCTVRLCFLLICIVVVAVFPLFAVLLNCPYPDPPVSASFFPFSSARQRGEGRPRGAFVAGSSRNQNRFAQVHLSSLSSSLWMAFVPSSMSTTPHSLASSAKFLRVHLISLSMSTTKMLSSTGSSTDP